MHIHYACMHIHIHIHMHTHTHIYAHTHLHTYIRIYRSIHCCNLVPIHCSWRYDTSPLPLLHHIYRMQYVAMSREWLIYKDKNVHTTVVHFIMWPRLYSLKGVQWTATHTCTHDNAQLTTLQSLRTATGANLHLRWMRSSPKRCRWLLSKKRRPLCKATMHMFLSSPENTAHADKDNNIRTTKIMALFTADFLYFSRFIKSLCKCV